MKNLLKIFITVIFSMSINTISMERTHQDIEIDLSNLPKDIWREIVKHGVNKNAQTEKEIFQMMDSLRATSKTTKAAVDNLVKTRGFKKNNPNYSYVDLKNDAMQDILIERAKKVVPLRTLGDLAKPNRDNFKKYKDEILNKAIKAEAINWSRYRLTIDPKFQEMLNFKLKKISERYNFNSQELEIILKMGANPNIAGISGEYIIFELASNTMNGINKSPQILELLLKYKADPNVLPSPERNETLIHRIILAIENNKDAEWALEKINILLNYVEIKKEDLKIAQYKLKNLKDDYSRSKLSQIIKILEKDLNQKEKLIRTII